MTAARRPAIGPRSVLPCGPTLQPELDWSVGRGFLVVLFVPVPSSPSVDSSPLVPSVVPSPVVVPSPRGR